MKNGSLVVEYSLTPTRRGRKPSNQPVLVNTGKMPRITRLMALAIKFEGLIRDGVVSDYADLARLGVVTRARMTQIMNLLNLAPDIQEEILFLPKTLPWFKSRIPCEAEFGWAFDSKAEWRISKTVSYANRTPPRMPLFQKVRLAERYDIAIMSCKGMGTTAGRTLIDDLSGKVKILVVRDFDKAGFSIFGTLKWDTRRHKHVIRPMVIDIGLRLEDVQKWNLPAEDVINDSDPSDNLVKNGATAEEVAFIRGAPIAGSGRKQKYKGRRVELNACTSGSVRPVVGGEAGSARSRESHP